MTALTIPQVPQTDIVMRAPLVGPVGDLALALDPTVIMRRAGLVPDPWQRDLLFDETDWWLLLLTRQGGKTAAISALALHTAITKPKSLTLVITPSERQSKEVLRRVADFYYALHGATIREDQISSLKIELGNGSRIIALPGSNDKTVRVYSAVDLLLIDEAARVPEELFLSVMPMLATSGGRAILASTPWFERGYFYNEWRHGGDSWRRVTVTADDCPRIDRKFLAREKRSKPASWFRQEYYCEWGSTASALFDHDMVDAMLTDKVEPYRPNRLRFA